MEGQGRVMVRGNANAPGVSGMGTMRAAVDPLVCRETRLTELSGEGRAV